MLIVYQKKSNTAMQASDLVPSTFNNGFNLAGYSVKEVANLGPCLEGLRPFFKNDLIFAGKMSWIKQKDLWKVQ